MIALNLRPTLQLADAVFEQLCQQNPDLRLERTAQGELIVMSPAGSESGRQKLSLSAQLWHWNQQGQLGVTFDSSAGFLWRSLVAYCHLNPWITEFVWGYKLYPLVKGHKVKTSAGALSGFHPDQGDRTVTITGG